MTTGPLLWVAEPFRHYVFKYNIKERMFFRIMFNGYGGGVFQGCGVQNRVGRDGCDETGCGRPGLTLGIVELPGTAPAQGRRWRGDQEAGGLEELDDDNR